MKPFFFEQPARLLLVILFPILFHSVLSATTVYSKQSGNWSLASTWQGGFVPNPDDHVVIKAGHTVTRLNNSPIKGDLFVYGTLIFQSNVSRDIYPGHTVQITGLLRIEAGSLEIGSNVSGAGTFQQTAGYTYFNKGFVMKNADIQGGYVYFLNEDNSSLSIDNLTLKNALIDVDAPPGLSINETMLWGNNSRLNEGSNIEIEASAVLTFESGGTFYNDAQIKNYGTIYFGEGTIFHVAEKGEIYNYGLLQFNVPASKTFYVGGQNLVNWGSQLLKKGAGSVQFYTSSQYYDAGESTFHVQQGRIAINAGNELNGLWRVDAGTELFLNTNQGEYAPFAASKFINNGFVNANIKFVGSNNTILEGNGKFKNMDIAKTGSEVTLSGSPEITTELRLTSGRIVLNQHDLRLGTAVLNIIGNYEGYIETNGTGACVRSCPLNSPVFFPVGNSDFAPVGITLGTGSTQDLVKVRVTDSFYGEYNGNSPACSEEVPVGVVGHNWFISEQTPGGSTAKVIAYWPLSAEGNGFNRSNCTVGRYLNGDWQPELFGPASDFPSISSAYKHTNVTGFGLFGVFDQQHKPDVNFITPLPETNGPLCEWEDLQFQAHTSPNADVLWTGPNGFQSNAHDPYIAGIQQGQAGNYTLKASQYGCPLQQVSVNVQVYAEPNASIIGPGQIQPGESATLTAAGGSSYLWNTGATTQAITVLPMQTTDYQVTVSNAGGCSSMALHTIQVLGASATTEAEGILGSLKIAPNPTMDASTLIFESATAGEAQLSITDLRGAQLHLQNVAITSGPNQLNISLASFPAGTYLVTLIRASEVKTVRLVKLMGE